MDQEDDYQVGYGKPPRASQFRKGRSGNPKGRPKASTRPESHLTQELKKQITVTEHGQRKRISKSEALMKLVVNKAISGEPAAIRIVFRHLERLQVLFDAVAAAQPAEQKSENPKDYTDEELLAIINLADPNLNAGAPVLLNPDGTPCLLPGEVKTSQL